MSIPAQIFRETLPLAYSLFGGAVASMVTTATDVLRLATSFSGPDADLSLKENVRFKFNARQRKDLMLMLDTVARRGNIYEDLMRYRERWLRIGERLHVCAAGNRSKYPVIAAAFDGLRNQPGAIQTFNRNVEAKVRAQTIDNDLLKLLAKRPGEFARRLDFLLRTSRQPQDVIASFSTAASGLTTKMLFELRKYFAHRLDATGAERVIFPKGKINKMRAIPDHRKAIDQNVLHQVDQVIGAELTTRLSKAAPMGKVFIDDALDEVVLPFNRRGDSATSTNVIKGARYGFDPKAPVLRFFVHWTGDHIDVDLSALFYADDLSVVGQVSFTNTQWASIVVHSGDIQSAPNGASEFIDVDVEKAVARGVRYVAMSVISFRGQSLNSFPCYAGYMERDALRSGKVYQPETLALKFDVNTPNTTHMPLMFDLVERKAVFIDMAAGGRSRSHVMGQSKVMTALLRSVIDMPKSKPTVGDVLRANVAARGALVADEKEAEVVFKATGLDLDAVLAMTQ